MKKLLLDIETAPNIAHVWGLWEQNIGLNQMVASGYVMCWSAKWHGDDKVMFDSVHRSKPQDMLDRVHALLDEADVVIHYNGKKFDIPTLNKEFAIHGMQPPAPYRQVDLCEMAKRQFRFPSNKLEYVALALGCTPKVTKRKFQGHELWVGCMANNPEAWAEMKTYNVGDVITLEEVYNKMLPWIKGHPNHGLYDVHDDPICTHCGSDDLQRRGYSRTATNMFARYQCQSCGSWMRSPCGEISKEERSVIMRQDMG